MLHLRSHPTSLFMETRLSSLSHPGYVSLSVDPITSIQRLYVQNPIALFATSRKQSGRARRGAVGWVSLGPLLNSDRVSANSSSSSSSSVSLLLLLSSSLSGSSPPPTAIQLTAFVETDAAVETAALDLIYSIGWVLFDSARFVCDRSDTLERGICMSRVHVDAFC